MPRTVFDVFALATMNPATGQLNPSGTTQALSYAYDAKNRLARAQIGANTADFVTYKINALGQRVQKTGAGIYAYSTTATIDAGTGNSPLARSLNFNARYVYDEQGRLIGEYAPDGKLISETVYFNDLPIATLRPKGANAGVPLGISGTTTGNPANGATAANANNVGNNSTTNRVNVEVFYVHADHLGTPRVVTRSTVATGANAPSSATPTSQGAINKAVWRHDSDPFGTSLGNSQPTENPQVISGTQTIVQAGTFRQNLRFPGQLADGESGKSYNYFRDYDPAVGRYTESDPIGLLAGLNTFAYVSSNPTTRIDPKGMIGQVLAAIVTGCVTGCLTGASFDSLRCVVKNYRGGAKLKDCGEKCFDPCPMLDACALGCVAGAFTCGIAGVWGKPPGLSGAGGGMSASFIFKSLFGFSVCDYFAGLGLPFGGGTNYD